MKLSEVVPEIIALAQATSNYWERELPKRYKNYPRMEEGEEDGPPPPEQVKLKELLATLPAEWLYALLAVADLGSRGLRVAEFASYHKRLLREWPPPALVNGLANRAALAEDLADGLDKLSAQGLDIDMATAPLVTASV